MAKKTRNKISGKTKIKHRTISKSRSKPRLKLKARVGRPRKVTSVIPAKKTVKKPAFQTQPKKANTKKTAGFKKQAASFSYMNEQTLLRSMDYYPRRPAAVKRLKPTAKRRVNPALNHRPGSQRAPRIHQFNYMKAPGLEHEFEVGDGVEVFCDHEKNRERIRGWVKGIVVQVDNKMVAVQFRSNVFLTDGWMVPDRILWYPVNSEHIRPVPGKKIEKKEIIPEY